MQENQPTIASAMKVPTVSRRHFIGSAGSAVLGAAFPSTLGYKAKASKMAGIFDLEEKVYKALFLKPKYRNLIAWLNISQQINVPGMAHTLAASMREYGLSLVSHPPSMATIEEFLNDPVFRQSSFQREIVGARPVREVAEELYRISHLTKAQMAERVEQRLNLPVLADAGAGNKVGGCPVPASHADKQWHPAGGYATSGRWQELASSKARVVAEPKIGR